MTYYYDYSYGYNGAEDFFDGLGRGLAVTLGVSAIFIWIISMFIGILTIVALWMLFDKAKENGWAAIIPFYNSYVLFKITWGNGWYFLLMLIPIANIVIHIITMVKLANVYGKGGGWACGLIFLYPIFLCIMAFDNSIQYVGEYGGGAFAGQTQQQSSFYTGQQTNTGAASQPGTKYCPYCGAALRAEDKFCLRCGREV
jgi:hypothetical protein